MAGGTPKPEVDISDLIADHDAVDAIDLAVLLQEALPVDLSELVGGVDPNGVLRVEATGSGGDVIPAAAAEAPEGFWQPLCIIFDDTSDPTTSI